MNDTEPGGISRQKGYETMKKAYCPRCGKLLVDSFLEEYTFFCKECYEDFYKFEVNFEERNENNEEMDIDV